MADVFISYARTERAEAEAVKQRLEALGLSVFLDVEGLDGGDIFSEVLDREVKTSKIVLGLWSPTALSRPWVQIECDIGKRRGVLIPVAIKPFRDMDVPAPFWNIQFVDLTDALHDADDPNWAKLHRSLARTLNRPDLVPKKPAAVARQRVSEPSPARAAPRTAVQASSTGSPLPGIIVAAVLLLAGGGGAFWYFDPMNLGLRAPEAQTAAAPDVSATPAMSAPTPAPTAAAPAAPTTAPATATAPTPNSGDPSSCAPLRSKWASASTGTDIAAMDGVIALIPDACPDLRAEAARRRTAAKNEEAAAARIAAQKKTPEPQKQVEVAATPPPPVDPCQQASSDWRSVQNGSEAALTSYISGLSAACDGYRIQAQDRLDKLVAARLVAESQQRAATQAAEQRRLAAAQFDAVTSAAKATGIEGKWKDPINVTGSRKSFLESRCYLGQQVAISNGQLNMGGYPSRILNVTGKSITIDGVTFTVEGDNMRKRFLTSGEEFIFWRCP